MELRKDLNILIVGLGLIGGSYARALTKKGYHVKSITKSKNSIDFALKNSIIEYGTTEIEPNLVGEADLVIFGLYPKTFVDWVKSNQHLFKSGAIITDVTGVKTTVVNEVQNILREDVEFIAAHPMAGREVFGVQNSDDAIFKDANFIVTPTEKNTEEAIEFCKELGKTLGFARISQLSPTEHDDVIGFVSQLTHCIAITLMTCNEMEKLEDYTGNSFRDLTRIARINDAMWSELFVSNKDALLRQMDMFSQKFQSLRDMLENDEIEPMREMMRRSTARRALFDKNDEERK